MSEHHPEGAAPFHISDLAALRPLVDAFAGTCLDSARPQYQITDTSGFRRDVSIFTKGSEPRGMAAHAGLGATLQTSGFSGVGDLIDLCSMTENTVLGLNDPWVKLKQTSYLLSERPHYVTIRLGCDLYYRVAERLLSRFKLTCGEADYVVNLRECTGSGAIEAALHAAWRAASETPGRRKLASFTGSFHGSNLGPILVSDHQPERGSGRVLLDRASNVEFFPVPGMDERGELDENAVAMLSTIERDGDDYFAVILEPISWRNAVHVVPTEFLRRLRDICSRKAICLIFDEVQTGFGFVGTVFFSEVCGVAPDIAVMGKGLTSGHGSLAVVVARRGFDVLDSPFGFKSNSGNMLALVAVDAVLDRLLGLDETERDTLPDWLPPALAAELQTGVLSSRYQAAAARIDALVNELRRRFPGVAGAAKGIGLFRGLELLGADGRPSERRSAETAKLAMTRGVHVRQASTALLIKPCVVIGQSEVDRALVRLSEALQASGSD